MDPAKSFPGLLLVLHFAGLRGLSQQKFQDFPEGYVCSDWILAFTPPHASVSLSVEWR